MKRLAFFFAALAAACGSPQAPTVAVTPAKPAAFRLTPADAAVAGTPISVMVEALDASGAVDASYRGTVQFSSDDAAATLPGATAFSAGDRGQKSVSVTFNTAGEHTLVAMDRDRDAEGSTSANVKHGEPDRMTLSELPSVSVAGTLMIGQVTALDRKGNLVKDFTGKVHFTSSDPQAVLPPDTSFSPDDKGIREFPFRLSTSGLRTITVSLVGGTATPGSAFVAVIPAAAKRIALEGLPSSVNVDTDTTVNVTIRDAFANVVVGYTGKVHFVVTDPAATKIPDLTFTPAMFGSADVKLQFGTEGDQSIIATDVANASITGSAATNVKSGKAAAYSLSALPGSALAGEPLALTITAVDAHGNVARNYGGSAAVTSTDASDRLPAAGGFSGGVRNVSLAFVTSGPHFASVVEVGGTIHADTNMVSVVSGDAVLFLVTGGSATAGNAAQSTVTAKDTFGNTVVSYSGTVSFSSSDAAAILPASFTFQSADGGQHTFSLTFKTAGTQSVAVSDGRAGGSASFAVSASAGAACNLIDLPATPAAGAQVGLRVVVRDAFGNVANGYTGTIALTSSDAAAQLGPAAIFTQTDAGAHAFTIQLRTAGSQTVTATDTSLSSLTCQGSATVVPGATLLAVAFAGAEAWAGTAVTATVTAQDAFANRVPTYAGTVAFSSSDAAAVKPANVTFAAADNGQKTVLVTFNTIGSQTFTATDTVAAATTGSGSQIVRGLLYTNPATGGKVRLVLNAAASNASVVQLDLVSNTSLFPLTTGTNDSVRNGVFAAGMNLPLDASKVGPDVTLLRTTAPAGSGAVLVLGNAPQAVGAALSNGVLYSGISQKRFDTTAGTGSNNRRGDVAVRPFPGGNSFYYSLRLKLTPGASPGTVFDGQALASNFRAAVRDRSGTDVYSGVADFSIGKLEVR